MNVRFLEVAEAEFEEAIAHYNGESEGLGYEFAAEVRRTIQRMGHFPEAWPQIHDGVRRCRCNRFPYGVIYQVRAEGLLIVAVMHRHRHPRAWRSRLGRDLPA